MRTCTRVMGERAPWPGVQENLSSRFQPSSHRIRSAGTRCCRQYNAQPRPQAYNHPRARTEPALRCRRARMRWRKPRLSEGAAGTSLRTWHGRLGHQQQTAPVRHRSERRHALRRRQWTSVPHCVYHALHVQHRRRGRCTHTLTRPHPRTHTPARADTTTVAETHAYRRACRRSVGSSAGLFQPLVLSGCFLSCCFATHGGIDGSDSEEHARNR